MISAKERLVKFIEFMPENCIHILLDVAKQFILDPEDLAANEDLTAHEKAMAEYARGECYDLEKNDWDSIKVE